MQSVSTVETAAGVAVGRWNDVADLAGRIALAAIFIMSGADKLFAHTAQTVQMMEAYRVPLAGLLVYPAGIVELAGGLALAVGFRARQAALLVALFTAASRRSSMRSGRCPRSGGPADDRVHEESRHLRRPAARGRPRRGAFRAAAGMTPAMTHEGRLALVTVPARASARRSRSPSQREERE